MSVLSCEVAGSGIRSVNPEGAAIDTTAAIQFDKIENNKNVLVALDDAGGIDM
jgi:hypothetical protein